ncbi:MAG: glycine cleavage system aminomethyltransferase GcvT [Chloroflexi bacterium]|nr:glycine cleavage system aminomethyltransferase GcvT [Chloroflexota bacterium]
MSEQPATGILRRTCLHDEHLRLGARLVPFAGWEMPVQYAGILEEHRAVRQRVGVFDVSHMGRFEYLGSEAGRLLRYVCTYDIARLAPGEGHYAAVCREDGGILDDVYVFCLPPEGAASGAPTASGGRGAGGEGYLLVANASNAEKVRDWIAAHMSGFDARFQDRHASTAMIAVQGPRAIEVLGGLLGEEAARSVRPRHCAPFSWRGETVFASRTGYTGEDGMELVTDAAAGPALWRALLEAGVLPCGLGARDTLRLEAALLLYGNDMDESVNPYDIGLGWVVTLDDGADFIGREALLRIREAGPQRLLVCLETQGRGVMRAGCAILHAGREAGKVTSGGYSPTLGVSIGMGFVPAELAVEGTELTVDVRGKPLSARVVPRPFYKRPRQP